eukprot:CAMPEP_0170496698 /NCGR_PEP_ID=MMETSP0208-20121228/22457_1 /TAXON_ID=197538 /ORGANISM="Strombidium inclinatum, Strain S3" /LENGTH=42 /DNA_ID= /DNA_START= /DNA_END= /DNA_ORIENTATION=
MFPTYVHEEKTVFIPPFSHKIHPGHRRDILNRPLKEMETEYN